MTRPTLATPQVSRSAHSTAMLGALLVAISAQHACTEGGNDEADASGDAGAAADASLIDASLADAGADAAPDECPFTNGLTWQGKTRFAYGVNYAWHHFAGDFGGISPWSQGGVTALADTHAAQLAEMRAHGVSVIRWWMFPDFRGDGVVFDDDDHPTGVTPAALADVNKALELAEAADVYLMFCIFSFDNFRPSHDVSGIWTRGLAPMVTTPAVRADLLDNVVRPLARAVDDSPYSHRMIAWDVINEPEWAMTGASPYGDQDYTPMGDLESLSHAVMESFVADVIQVLRAESTSMITVGATAFKWAHAWSNVDIDFYQFHMYSWINDYWPYSNSPAEYELDDKPLIIGEYPIGDLAPGISYSDVTSSWYGNGYAGSLSWQYNEASAAQLDLIADFVTGRECETSF